jgi:hypothetical protein
MNASKKQKFFLSGLVFAIFLLLLNPPTASGFSQNDSGAGSAGGNKGSGIPMQSVSGRVVETMDSGGYTYALVDKDGVKTWVALPKSRIEVGNEVTCQPGMVMNNFSSSSLNRTFKHIVFSSGLTSSSGASSPAAGPSTQDEETTVPSPKLKEPESWKDF